MKNFSEITQIAANIGSLAIAVVALILTFNVENRNAERFSEQLRQSQQIARANIRPLLALGESGFVGIKYIGIQNYGLGTAVVKTIYFEKEGQKVINLADLFNFKKSVVWDNYYTFTNAAFYLRAGENLTMIHLTADNLKNQGYSEGEITEIMREFDSQKKNIAIHIEYEDLLENKQEPINIEF